MKFDFIEYFQRWYLSRCDGVWEHSYGFDISTIDNPGWKVNITGEINKVPLIININNGDDDWFIINSSDTEFKGYSSPQNLSILLEHAHGWLNT